VSATITNGNSGLYTFPVTARIAYCIRDNHQCCSHMDRSTRHYDIFVLFGVNPTSEQFNTSFFLNTANTYTDACQIVDDSIEKVYRITPEVR
jgi:hypothetical protein